MAEDFNLPTEEEITQKRKEGDLELEQQGITESQRLALRRYAKVDKFFLAHGILKYKRLSLGLHNELCKWLEETEYVQYRKILLPRSHYKSTICTITDSIQLALPDDAGEKKYPYNLGPDIRILLAHNVAEKAEEFLYAIMMHFMNNPLLMALFPELVPNQRVQKINQKSLGLPRNIISPQQTFTAMGVGGKNQGAHYNYIKADDLYGEAERASTAERTATVQWVDNLQAYLDTPAKDHIDFIGTRWAFDDIYAHIDKTYEDQLKSFVKGAEVLNKDGERVPIFPEQFTTNSFKILKKNRVVWNAQYANNPTEGAARFQEVWLKYYNRTNFKTLTILNGKESYRVNTAGMDKIMFIDPATKGLGGLVLTGTDVKQNIYILEAMKKAWKPEELTEEVFRLVLRYGPRLVVIEEVLFSILFQSWWQREMSVRRINFKIETAKTNQKHKEERVQALSTYFTAGQIYLDRDFEELITEFKEFGATENYHMLDALAYGPRYWRAAVNSGNLEANNELNKLVDFYSI